jgi:putative sugar O-methyltransferase
MGINIWPCSSESSQRLQAFQNSPYFPGRYRERGHEVSQFWLDAIRGIHAFAGRDFIVIHSLSKYVGPEELQLRRLSHERRRRFHRIAAIIGKLGSEIPNTIWALPDRIARMWLRGSAWLNRARDRERALRAFQQVSGDNCTLTLHNLTKIPVFSDQFDDVPALVLYFACVVNTLEPQLRGQNIRFVLEIGPGEAVLAIALNQLFGWRFVLVDLPEVLTMAFAMISYYAPSAVTMLPHEDAEIDSRSKADFILLVPEQVDRIMDSSVDLAINMSSFQEMTYPLIQTYFQLIERSVRPGGFFYCLNETKFMRHRDGEQIEFAKFPWSSQFDDLFCEEFKYWSAFGGYERQHRLQIKRMDQRRESI